MGSNPKSNISANQVLQKCYDEVNDRLRTDSVLSASLTVVDINVEDTNDSIKIGKGDGATFLNINPDGSINSVVTATDLDIRNLSASQDNIKISDGVDSLAINNDGSINSIVTATDLDIRDLSHTQDSIKIGDGTDFIAVNSDGTINVRPYNASGLVDFNSGTTSDQTIRTSSNSYGIVQSSSPTVGINGTVKQQTVDSFGKTAIVQSESMYAEWGQMFSCTTSNTALTGTTETPFFLFINPNGSGKTAKIFNISFGPTLGNNYVTYRLYFNATITSNGTGLTEVGLRQTNQNSAIVTAFSIPTISSNGTLFDSKVVSGLSGLSQDLIFNFSLNLEENNNILITRQLSANATIGGITIRWAEL